MHAFSQGRLCGESISLRQLGGFVGRNVSEASFSSFPIDAFGDRGNDVATSGDDGGAVASLLSTGRVCRWLV